MTADPRRLDDRLQARPAALADLRVLRLLPGDLAVAEER